MKRTGLLIAIAIIAVAVLGIGGCLVGNYNHLVTAKEAVDQRWAQVDNQLQRRNDLIGSLVETVKGTAIQEQEVFGKIADARAQMAGAKTPTQAIQAGQAMDSALGRLLVVVENYPQLKSNEAFMQLMDELAGTENRLATERMRYNQEVQSYNVLVKRFPMNFFASMFGYKEAPYYQIPEAARQAPKVDFGGLRQPATGGAEAPRRGQALHVHGRPGRLPLGGRHSQRHDSGRARRPPDDAGRCGLVHPASGQHPHHQRGLRHFENSAGQGVQQPRPVRKHLGRLDPAGGG